MAKSAVDILASGSGRRGQISLAACACDAAAMRAERLLATKGTKETTIHGRRKKVSTLIVLPVAGRNERSESVALTQILSMGRVSTPERSTSSVDASSEFCRDKKAK
jgi:hypothetical protein